MYRSVPACSCLFLRRVILNGYLFVSYLVSRLVSPARHVTEGPTDTVFPRRFPALFSLWITPPSSSFSWSRGIALSWTTLETSSTSYHSHTTRTGSLCTFYRAGLNIATKAQLSGEGPRESFANYIEWVLVSCRSSLTTEDDTSPTQDPEPSQPAPRHAEFEPEPTADDEPEPRATESKIATEPEPYTSDQVREPATTTTTGECKMEQVRAMESPAHCTTAGGELEDNSGDLIDFSTEVLENNSGDLIDFFTEISTCHIIPAFHHLCSGLAAGLPASIGVRAGGSLSSASSFRVQNSAAPPRLSAPSSPSSPIGPPAPLGSLVFPAPPWSVVVSSSPQDSVPLAAPRHSVPPALWTSSLPPAQPPSSVAPAPPQTSGSPPWPSGSSVSPWIFGSPSPPRAPPPAAPPPSVGPLESSAFPPPWLLPPSAPPWVVIMAAVWVSFCFSCSGSLLFVPLTHYPDSSLCTFYRAGLNIATKAQLSGEGPRESFANYIEWVLVSCRSSLTTEDDTSPTQDPEPSQPAPRHAEFEPEPTADDEPEPRATESKIATEPEPYTSDQVREPATTTTTGSARWSNPPPVQWARCGSASFHRCQGWRIPQLRLQLQSPELRGSTTALSALVSIVAHRSTSSTGLPRLSGSALVGRRLFITSGLCSSGCASSLRPTGSVDLLPPSGTASILCRSGSAADLRISALALRILGVALDLRLSVSASGSSASGSASVGRPPRVVSLSSTMAPPSVGSTVGRHHGCGLGLLLLLLLRVPPVPSLAPSTFVTPLDYGNITRVEARPGTLTLTREGGRECERSHRGARPKGWYREIGSETSQGKSMKESGL
ncbi:Opioid growth factor receptor [Labeo rohita]|uniref:Opioid growth factor receptor n=1 Tax=Labeo rohita TaxID=84645 RepID=A0ABQ8L4D4_LABRO|nr:Opioid growth factor receptor [Labeo rohita]